MSCPRLLRLVAPAILAVSALTAGGCNMLSGNTPLRNAIAMEKGTPDEKRKAINYLVKRDWGRRDPYTDRYAQIAKDAGQDYLVRATAIRALNRSRDAASTDVFVQGLSDANALVRLESAKALANVPDEAAIPRLVQVVNGDEDKDVRIAAADALKHYRNIDVARALAAQLAGRDFGVAWQSRRSLRHMTGADHRYDEGKWLEFLTSDARPLG